MAEENKAVQTLLAVYDAHKYWANLALKIVAKATHFGFIPLTLYLASRKFNYPYTIWHLVLPTAFMF
jgi:hypothetical protein